MVVMVNMVNGMFRSVLKGYFIDYDIKLLFSRMH